MLETPTFWPEINYSWCVRVYREKFKLRILKDSPKYNQWTVRIFYLLGLYLTRKLHSSVEWDAEKGTKAKEGYSMLTWLSSTSTFLWCDQHQQLPLPKKNKTINKWGKNVVFSMMRERGFIYFLDRYQKRNIISD